MSRYFVSDGPVAVPEFDPAVTVSDAPPNVIWIKAKMDVATDGAVKNELFTMGADMKTVEARLGDNQLALLVHNIVRWEGPDLDGVPCTPAQIRKMDPTEPHLQLVLDEIGRRNKRPESPSPKSHGASTSANAGASDLTRDDAAADRAAPSLMLVNGISKSSLQSAINGRLNKSGD